jgi:NADH dehydrogenase/NADH:ubiquinone oxidoreductase subunit G
MVTIVIDGKKVKVKEGTTALEAARKLGIDIPTLCHHEALAPYGACRICMVELKSGKWSKLETACTYPVWEGLEVITGSDKVVNARKFIVELLLARCPNSKEIRELAGKLGLHKTRFTGENKDEKCILCGLCTRVCKELIGASAISFINRGIERVVETPFKIDSDTCIGCGACASVCPTGVIKIEDCEGNRKIETWHTELELVKCKDCGERFATSKALKYAKEKLGLPLDAFDQCAVCKRKALSKELLQSSKP